MHIFVDGSKKMDYTDVIGEGQGGLRGCVIGTICAAIVMVAIVGVSAVIY
jgi:hypothetical protein